LAELDIEDPDQLDLYNRRQRMIINLITTLCCLYEQRNKTLIKLSGLQLYPVINKILDSYKNNQIRMAQLGNPIETDCLDENEYECLRKMCTIYAEHLYIFMHAEGKEFVKDKPNVKGQVLNDLVVRFRTDVMPTLTEAFLIFKCSELIF